MRTPGRFFDELREAIQKADLDIELTMAESCPLVFEASEFEVTMRFRAALLNCTTTHQAQFRSRDIEDEVHFIAADLIGWARRQHDGMTGRGPRL